MNCCITRLPTTKDYKYKKIFTKENRYAINLDYNFSTSKKKKRQYKDTFIFTKSNYIKLG